MNVNRFSEQLHGLHAAHAQWPPQAHLTTAMPMSPLGNAYDNTLQPNANTFNPSLTVAGGTNTITMPGASPMMTHSYYTASPQGVWPASGLPQPPPTSSTRVRTITCHLGGHQCPGLFTLTPPQVKRGIAEHIHQYHRVTGDNIECSWTGCVCAAQSGRLGRCSDRPAKHPAHVSDLADHVLHSHFDFRYLCDLCGRAQWSTPSALARHTRTCRGVCEVRCPGCLDMFESEVILEKHMEAGACFSNAV
jgi:hypothetical protein